MDEIGIEVVPPQPHNGKNITKTAISPQSKYAVTYSEEDNSFNGWYIKDKTDEKDQNEDKLLKLLKRPLTFFGWLFQKLNNEKDQNEDEPAKPVILEDEVTPYKYDGLLNFNFKVSDKKIIMCENENNETGNYITFYF